jgi:beta-glucanase (GH16 family)
MLSKMLLILFAVCAVVLAAPPAMDGFTCTWSDDFIGTYNSLPNPSDWIVDTGTVKLHERTVLDTNTNILHQGYPGSALQWGTGEVQTHTSRPENLRLTGDGNLQITPLRDHHGHWTSGRIETQHSHFQAQPGGRMRISARIMLPDVQGEAAAGYWPAFWTMGDGFRDGYKH